MIKQFARGFAVLSVAVCAQAHAGTVTVSSSAQLAQVLPTLKASTTVLLAPGTYDDVVLQNLNAGVNITVRSANLADRAQMGRVSVRNSSRLRFDQVNFNMRLKPGEWDTTAGVVVRGSDMVHFTSCRFSGTPNNDPNDDGMLLRYIDSSNIVVLNNSFREGRLAIGMTGSRWIQVVSNSVAMVREGLNMSAVQQVVVDRNLYQDIRPNEAQGDHSDAMQFFATGTTTPTINLTVSNNAMLLGGAKSQGIFIQNGTGDPRYEPQSVTVVNNIYFGVMRAGISVTDAERIDIRRNTVVTAPGATWDTAILVRGAGSTPAVVSGNITPYVMVLEGATTTQTANVLLANMKSGTGVPAAAQFIGNIATATPTVRAFGVRAGSAAATAQAGAVVQSEIGAVAATAVAARYKTLQSRIRPNDGLGAIL